MAATVDKAFKNLIRKSGPDSVAMDLIPWYNYGHCEDNITYFVIDGDNLVFRMRSEEHPNGLTWDDVERFIQLCKVQSM